MSSELERRLEAMLAERARAGSGSGGEGAPPRTARAAAGGGSEARRSAPQSSPSPRRVVLLGDRGRIARRRRRAPRQLRREAKAAPVRPTQLSLPHGATWHRRDRLRPALGRHEERFRLQGLPVTAAALSPHALYVAAGIGHSLVAMAPNGRRAWSHPRRRARSSPIAWAPDGLAYRLRRPERARLVLHVIWGNGTHDTVLDRSRTGRDAVLARRLTCARVRRRRRQSDRLRRRPRVAERRSGEPARSQASPSRREGPRWPWRSRAACCGRAPESSAGKIAGTARGIRLARTATSLSQTTASAHPSCDVFAPDGASRGSYPAARDRRVVTPKLVIVRLGQSLLSGRTTLARSRPARPCVISRSASAARPRSRRTGSRARPLPSRTASASRPRAPRSGR